MPGLGYIVRLLHNIKRFCHMNGLTDKIVSQTVQLLYKLYTVPEFRQRPFFVVVIHVRTPTGECDGLFRWNTEIYTGCFPADTTNIACVGNTAAVPLAAAGAVRQISGGLQIPLVEDQIAAASAVEPCLPAEVVDCIKQIQRFLPHKQKLPGIEHIVKLGFNLGIQTKSVNLEIS